MTPRWRPGDDELDAVARSLDVDAPGADRTEHNRTAILAAAATRKPPARYSAAPFVAAGLALAAVATVALVIGARTAAPIAQAPSQLVTPIGVARFERVTDWPDYVVRVDDGAIAVQVGKLAARERFRVKTADAEVEVRGTKFDVGVETGRLTSVAVYEGRVEVRTTDQQVVILLAGERWAPVQTARRDEADLPGRPPELSPPSDHPATAAPAATANRAATTTAAHAATAPPDHATTAAHTTTTDRAATTAPAITWAPARPAVPPTRASSDRANQPAPGAPPAHGAPHDPAGALHNSASAPHEVDARVPPSPPPPAAPGEAEFRAGWAALRAGDPAAAATAFGTACKTAQSDAIGEDACFWAGAAAKRAGTMAAARAALAQFLRRFPTSGRAAEASALLGWMLYDAGELDAAEPLFRRAEHDRVPKVRDSATRGLTAIDRKRHGTP
jgi:TolA-binding protein